MNVVSEFEVFMLKFCKFKELHYFSLCGLHRHESVVPIPKVSYNLLVVLNSYFFEWYSQEYHRGGGHIPRRRELPPCWHLKFVYRGGNQILIHYSRAEFSVIQINIRPVGIFLKPHFVSVLWVLLQQIGRVLWLSYWLHESYVICNKPCIRIQMHWFYFVKKNLKCLSHKCTVFVLKAPRNDLQRARSAV